ncbi:hypothetical protein acdb102_40630 [Acidothermaceae bacterium B102]|nr:hypothetical protein acdb102_40630 [Acidothermaceae bacterium B102]
MAVDRPGVRRVPLDLYEWNDRKRRRYKVMTWLLILTLFAIFATVCATVGAPLSS